MKRKSWMERESRNGNNAKVKDSKGDVEGKRLRPRQSGDRKSKHFLNRLLKKLTELKPVVSNGENDEPEVTVMKRRKSHMMGPQ